ncbi:MAG: hypothetical protein HY000_07260 [Planctomycetes bacterium]|nr:hypothetical protein [Planctomycetota bacterium]
MQQGNSKRLGCQFGIASLLLLMAAVAGILSLLRALEPRATVTGTVTLGGQPLSSGSIELVMLSMQRQNPKRASIRADGTYLFAETDRVAPGTYRVGISGQDSSGTLMRKRYSDPRSSGLKLSLRAGRNVANFDF